MNLIMLDSKEYTDMRNMSGTGTSPAV